MKYTAIAETGGRLVRLLKTYMVPDMLANPDHIGLCSPADRGDFEVGIFLYDIKENDSLRTQEMVSLNESRQRYPSSYLDLYYMITAYSMGDIKYRAEEEQRILGGVVQILRDSGTLGGEEDLAASIELLNLSLEEKMRVWTVPNAAYKTSLFYRVGPVEVESARTRTTSRVTDVEFKVKE